ncbi:hypothetical protein GE061_000065 [Apolygus lucorum]|uniref:MADF domain-containing protein n=1 Tax=Apolygus lucorum TaxID=248454 RepID=A0A8S9Y3K4_APOLU|nr:hypothetical protein GE061_000065 [Apolygus lucorum]
MATNDISGELYMTSSIAIPISSKLHDRIEASQPKTKIARNLKTALLDEIKKRLADIETVPHLAIATILDPRYKAVYFKKPEAIGRVMMDVKKLMKQESAHSPSRSPGSATDSDDSGPKDDSLFGDHSKTVQRHWKNSAHSSVDTGMPDQLALYMKAPAECDLKKSPLTYWANMKPASPELSKIAIRYVASVATSHPSHKNVEMTNRTWEEIAITLATDVETVKKRWKSLRDRFVKEIKKNATKVTGSGANRVVPWVFLPHMEFLRLTVVPRPTISNFSNKLTLTDLAGMDQEEIIEELIFDEEVSLGNTRNQEMYEEIIYNDEVGDGDPDSESEVIEPSRYDLHFLDITIFPASSTAITRPSSQTAPSTSRVPGSTKMTNSNKKKRISSEDQDALEVALLQKLNAPDKSYSSDEMFYLSVAKDVAVLPLSSRLKIREKTLKALAEEFEKEGMITVEGKHKQQADIIFFLLGYGSFSHFVGN